MKTAVSEWAMGSVGAAMSPQRVPRLVNILRNMLGAALLTAMSLSSAWAELPVPSAVWASMGQATHSVTGNTMNIEQASPRAILNWDSFNIGAGNAVNFNQPSTTAIALNRIHQADPSRILGTLSANGQVYLINQNGFLFGEGARVNTHSLVTSTLNVPDDVFDLGITKTLEQDGSAAFRGNGEVYLKDANGNYILDTNGDRQRIKIQIDPGAELNSAEGGRILILAPDVENAGTISTPGGQAILAAATDKVYLQEAGGDEGIRGLLVEVGTGGQVNNLGQVTANRGNITLMGYAVNQQGRVSATTAVRSNGSIRLLAREGAFVSRTTDGVSLEATRTVRAEDNGDGLGTSASVTLGQDSVTEVLPELDSSETAIDEQVQEASQVALMGHVIELQDNARIAAPSGDVTLTATRNPGNPALKGASANDSRIQLDSGSRIDVSGSVTTVLPMSRNLVSVDLRSYELRDSPLQKGGPLDGATVVVDVRKGTPVADVSGKVAAIQRTVAERTSTGGSVTIASEGDAIVNRGALIDFSGGAVNYLGGFVNTTKLVLNGEVIDIGDLQPDLVPDAILGTVSTSLPKWGISRSYDIPGPIGTGLYEDGYTAGAAAGAVTILAHALLLDGTLKGSTTADTRQRLPGQRPAGGRLTVDLARAPSSTQQVLLGGEKLLRSLGIHDPFPEDAQRPGQPVALQLVADYLERSGIRNLSIETNGLIEVHSGDRYQVPAGGSLNLTGGEIDIAGSIRAPAADLTLQTTLLNGSAYNGSIHLGSNAGIDTRGLWVNDSPLLAAASPGPLEIDGGDVALRAQGDVMLDSGSSIATGGGAWLSDTLQLNNGRGGDLTLAAQGVNGSSMRLEGALSGLSAGTPGKLNILSNEILIGTDTAPVPGTDGLLPLVIASDLFSSGGFSAYNLTSNMNGITVATGAAVAPQTATRVFDATAFGQATGGDMDAFSHAGLLPLPQRPGADISLALAQTVPVNNSDAAVRIGPGAHIRTDPGGKIALTSNTDIFVDGTVLAPGGDIDLHLTPPVTLDRGFRDNQAIWLASGSLLDAAGMLVAEPNPLGLRRGEVRDGGTIRVRADRGYIVAEQGAGLDVSGSAAVLDLPVLAAGAPGSTTAAQIIGSHAGSVQLTAAEGILFDATLRADAGAGPGTHGGMLGIELNQFLRNEPDIIGPGQTPFPQGLRRIDVVTGSESQVPAGLAEGDAIPAALNGLATVDTKRLAGSGIDDLALASTGSVRFTGDVTLAPDRRLVIDATRLDWQAGSSAAAGEVTLASRYIALGSTRNNTPVTSPLGGDGTLRVDAGFLELVGGATLEHFGDSVLNSQGDLRLRGVRIGQSPAYRGGFAAAGSLSLLAAQIYPATLTDFDITLDGGSDSVLHFGTTSGTLTPVLSAGGQLHVRAPSIEQDGIIQAPFGTIALDATERLALGDRSITSTSAHGQIIPFGQTEGGIDWIYPVSNQLLVFDSDPATQAFAPPPHQNIQLSGDNIELAGGAVVDLSAGGDLYAYEFIPGNGGSSDFLATDQAFAILPALGSTHAPYDPREFPDSGLAVGDNVYLSGTDGLPAGEYVLLPAHYALLDGAWLVTPQPGTRDLLPGAPLGRQDGAPVIAGYRFEQGSGVRDPRWSGFAVQPGSASRIYSEYQDSLASEFFVTRALATGLPVPLLPTDAGQLSLTAATSLQLEAVLLANALPGGRGGRVDISANALAVVNVPGSAQTPTGTPVVELSATDLDALDVESLLLGGTRAESSTGDGTRIDVQAMEVTIGQDVQLSVPEIILTGRNSVRVESGAQVRATGSGGVQAQVLQVSGDGALLHLSDGAQTSIVRSGASGGSGELIVADGSVLGADGSILADASKDTVLLGRFAMSGGSLNLGAQQVSLGDVPAGTPGLVFSVADLAAFAVDELVLSSRGRIDLYGDVDLNLDRLVFDAAGLGGFGTSGALASLRADSVRFSNLGGAVAEATTGSGALQVAARQLEQGAGTFGITGFSSVGLQADADFTGDGAGTLNVAGDLLLQAGHITAHGGADTTIDASGYTLVTRQVEGATSTPVSELGARLSLLAARIEHGGRIELPAGQVTLAADGPVTAGDLQLLAGSTIDVSGRSTDFGIASVVVPAGKVALASASGDVVVQGGAAVDLDGDTEGGAAGQLMVHASQGRILLDGDLSALAQPGYAGGSIDLDALDVSSLLGNLAAAGFSAGVQARQRSGDLVLAAGEQLSARTIGLSADQGGIEVAGALSVSGVDGGRIRLQADADVTLATTALLDATAGTADGNGGKVLLASRHGDIRLTAGAAIDVSGGVQGMPGTVILRAQRRDSNADGQDDDVAVAPIAATITGVTKVDVEATRNYDAASFADTGQIGSSDIASINTDTTGFMVFADTIAQRLGATARILPGVEVQSDADLTLASAWDLIDWRYTGTPGLLSLRAQGDLNLDRSLSDAFAPNAFFSVTDYLQEGESWGYHLVAGADLSAADRAAIHGSGDVKLASGTVVRTGTGDIEIDAGGAIRLADDRAVIYTAGRPEPGNRYGSLSDEYAATFYAEYPVDGGDIHLHAGGDIQGAVTDQFFTDWLVRLGNWTRNTSHSGELPTAWGIAFDEPSFLFADNRFRQNIGALGGGDVSIYAGGDIHDLSVMIPTTGKPIGVVDPFNQFEFLTNEVKVAGGGDVDVRALGNIYGGVYYVEQGNGRISAGGGLLAGRNQGLYPVMALGDSRISVSAVNSIGLDGVINPTLLPVRNDPYDLVNNYYFTYDPGVAGAPPSGIELNALSGDILLSNDSALLKNAINLSFELFADGALTIYPGALQAVAHGGDIELRRSFSMYPAYNGGLSLLARDNIWSGVTPSGASVNINVSDTDPVQLPQALLSTGVFRDIQARLAPNGPLVHAELPVHRDDTVPSMLATLTGNIRGRDPLRIDLPERALIRAGRDFRDIDLHLQNVSAQDVSRVEAGRDIRYANVRNEQSGALINFSRGIQLAGPGQLNIQASHDIDLGSSTGVTTVGNTYNAALADRGADINLVAGLNGAFDLHALAQEAVVNAIADGVILFAETTADIDTVLAAADGARHIVIVGAVPPATERAATFMARFDAATPDEQFAMTVSLFYNELEQTARLEAPKPRDQQDFTRGFDAVSALFPGQDYRGDLTLFFSKVHTVDGGNINLMVPGGLVNAGLAASFSGAKPASELGIVAQADGAINAFVEGDFLVNQSRVFTLNGGDILIWSSEGDVDAGRGAKSAIAAPPPVVSFDQQGNLVVKFPPVVAGSGIRTAASTPGQLPGDVIFGVPGGVVNAGEAGIGGQNVIVAAADVIGAANIDIGGVSIGVPTTDTGGLSGLSGLGSVTASVSKAAEESVSSVHANDAGESGRDELALITVDVIGFGDCADSDRGGKGRCR